jgi:hypothetical protein
MALAGTVPLSLVAPTFGRVPGMKTWLTVGVIIAIVVYAAGILSRSRAARGK